MAANVSTLFDFDELLEELLARAEDLERLKLLFDFEISRDGEGGRRISHYNFQRL